MEPRWRPDHDVCASGARCTRRGEEKSKYIKRDIYPACCIQIQIQIHAFPKLFTCSGHHFSIEVRELKNYLIRMNI